MVETDLKQRVYRHFSPAPLGPDQTNLYVELGPVRGDLDAVNRLENKIRLAEGESTCQVLAGHRGSGKSTELFRLKKRLESGNSPYYVVYVETDREMDRNDVDFSDILIAIVRQIATKLKEHAQIDLKPGLFKGCLERLKQYLPHQIDIESFELDLGFAKLGGILKGSPDARAEIRKLLEPDTGSWLHAANDIISKAVSELTQKGKKELVVLVDDLDKMVVRKHDTNCNTDEYLFVNRAAQLTAFDCHVVYTMPLSLVYSHQEQTIRNSYGGHVPVVPMTKIAARPPGSAPYEPGVEKFRQVITQRLQAARVPEAEFSKVFADENVQNRLIALSGGQLTELMTLVRESIITHGLPIDAASLDRAEREGRREYARQLLQHHWPILESIRKDGLFERTAENTPAFAELLVSRAILQYVNDIEWYGLNPMVAALAPPEPDS